MIRRATGVLLVAGGIGVSALVGSLIVGAADSRPDRSPVPTLSQQQVADAAAAIRESPVLRELSGGAPFSVVSTGDWKIVGEIVGTASLIRFDKPTTLDGEWPTLSVRNAVSEAELAEGATVPEKLDIDDTVEQRTETAVEYSVLVDFNGDIKAITAAPAAAPPAPAPDPDAVAPPTNKRLELPGAFSAGRSPRGGGAW